MSRSVVNINGKYVWPSITHVVHIAVIKIMYEVCHFLLSMNCGDVNWRVFPCILEGRSHRVHWHLRRSRSLCDTASLPISRGRSSSCSDDALTLAPALFLIVRPSSGTSCVTMAVKRLLPAIERTNRLRRWFSIWRAMLLCSTTWDQTPSTGTSWRRCMLTDPTLDGANRISSTRGSFPACASARNDPRSPRRLYNDTLCYTCFWNTTLRLIEITWLLYGPRYYNASCLLYLLLLSNDDSTWL